MKTCTSKRKRIILFSRDSVEPITNSTEPSNFSNMLISMAIDEQVFVMSVDGHLPFM